MKLNEIEFLRSFPNVHHDRSELDPNTGRRSPRTAYRIARNSDKTKTDFRLRCVISYRILILVLDVFVRCRVTRCACSTTSFIYWTMRSWRTSRASRRWRRTRLDRCSRPRRTALSKKSYFPSSRSCTAWKKDAPSSVRSSVPPFRPPAMVIEGGGQYLRVRDHTGQSSRILLRIIYAWDDFFYRFCSAYVKVPSL